MKKNIATVYSVLGAVLLAGAPVRAQAPTATALANLKVQMDSVDAQIAAGKLDKVHHFAVAINAAAGELDKDSSLAPEKKKRVSGYVKNIAKLTDAMHDAADAKNLDGTKKEEKKLKAQVDLLAKQFGKPAKAKTDKAVSAPETK